MVQLVRHPQTKGRETDRLHLNHRATSRLYLTRDTGQQPTNIGSQFERLRHRAPEDQDGLSHFCPTPPPGNIAGPLS